MFYWTVHLDEETFRNIHSAVTVGNKVYSFEGVRDEGAFSNQIHVRVFNTVSLRWKKFLPVTTEKGECPLEVPSARNFHTAVLIDHIIYIWGGVHMGTGSNGYWTYCNVLYAFDADSHRWFKPKISGILPEGRQGHSACVLGKDMYIYGGENRKTYTDNIYKLDTSTMVWSLINTRGTSPPASLRHTATIIGKKMYVFGGAGEPPNIYYNTIRVFDTETNLWLSPPSIAPPEERQSHCAFSYNRELYILGGHTWWHNLDDLWKLNPVNLSWKKVEPKGKFPDSLRLMCCCVVGDRITLFRAFDNYGDLYILDLSPSLKTLCKLAAIQYGLDQSGLTHDVRWELNSTKYSVSGH